MVQVMLFFSKGKCDAGYCTSLSLAFIPRLPLADMAWLYDLSRQPAYFDLIGAQLRTHAEQFGHVELSHNNLHEIQVDRRTYGVLLGGGLLRSIGAANFTASSYSMLPVALFACCVVAVVSGHNGATVRIQGTAPGALRAAGRSLVGAIVLVVILGVAKVL